MADVKTLTVNNVTYNIKDETARQSLADVVHKTGDETIGGEKTFTEVMQGVAPDSNSNDGSIPTTAWVRNSLGLDYANPNLSNLNSEGKNIGNWSNNVSNCIVKDPNNIIYTFDNSGTFTLKAGSKVYVPDGNGGYIPVGEQWTEPSQTNLSFYGPIVYDGSRYLMIKGNMSGTSGGYVTTSTDGINWTEPVSTNLRVNARGFWQSVIKNGSTYLAISSKAYVSTSTDGVNWTEPAETDLPSAYIGTGSLSKKDHFWRGLSFGNNVYVACSSPYGYIAYSQDGISWTRVSEIGASGSPNRFQDSAFGNGKFVVIGSSGYISTSTNGTNWTTPAQNTTLQSAAGWFSLVFDGTRFIALSQSGYISTSTDGENWTAPTQKVNNTSLYYMCYNYNDYKLIALSGGDKTICTSSRTPTGLNFKEVVIQNDISISASGNGTPIWLFVTENGTGLTPWYNEGTWIYSGTSFPTGTGHGVMFYNTNENTIRYTFNDGASWSEKLSFPIARIFPNTAGTRFDRVGEVFDGIVWIGSHVALLPGLTLAFPNGRNPDGSCKNIIKTVNKVTTADLYSRNTDWLLVELSGDNLYPHGWWSERFYTQFPKKAPEANDWMIVWDERRNQFYRSDNGAPYIQKYECVIARYRRDGNTQYMPKSWELKRAFRAIERFDILHMLDLMYPVGSIYLEASNTGSCPLEFVMQGSRWELVSNDRALWGGNGSNAHTWLSETLPNHRHWLWVEKQQNNKNAPHSGTHNNWQSGNTLYTSWASESNSIYNNNHVRPNSYVVNVWRRVQ